MDNALFPPEQKDVVFDKSDLLSIYMYGKGTREDPYYFDEELPSNDNDDDDEEMKDNKIDKKIKKTYLTTNHQEHWLITKTSKPYLHKKKKNTAGLVIVISVE